MSRKRTLEAGDTLARDLLHPQTAQILLPAGTVLTESYIFKIELLRLTDVAIECLRPPPQEEENEPDAAPGLQGPMDFDLFSKAKEVMVRLEELGRAYGTARGFKALDSFGIREILTDLVQIMVDRLEKVLPGRYMDLRCHDYYLYSHSINVAMMSIAMGLALKYDRTRLFTLGSAALLADIGKFRLPRHLLHKTEELSEAERALVQDHGRLGAEVVSNFNWARGSILFVIENHHERFDGSGYPRGLRGSQIGEEAAIVGLADAYDAMISDQPYRKRLDPAVAYRIIQSLAGKEWDPGLVWAFQRYIAPYPLNSLVKLNTGQEARVIAVRPEHLNRPIVMADGNEYDLSKDRERRIVAAIIPRRYYREKITMSVEVRVHGRDVFPGTLSDLSLNGLSLVDSPIKADPGTEVDVTIPIPAKRASIQIKGNVVWCKANSDGKYQMGLAFKQISATNKQALLETMWGPAQAPARLPPKS
ncbi:MAG: PilZ domain-containing protein [Candidatus Sericytochromatia bacterium]|nr:PilZ domain-containing protein [Candidatus Tanganyikabacteria bacterium]